MSKDSEDWTLLVSRGVHEGAHAAFPDQVLQVIGTADNCDVCLVDDGLQDRHCALSRLGDAVTVRSLAGDVRVSGRLVDGNVTLPAEHCESIELGEAVVLKLIPRAMLDAEREALANPVDTGSPVVDRRLSLWTTGALCAVLLVCAAWVAAQDAGQTMPAVADPLAEVLAAIEHLGLADAIEAIDDQGRLIVSGVANAEDLKLLKMAVQASAGDAVFQLATPEQLLEQVTGVFRTNGYTADLKLGEGGSVIVQNLDPDDPAVGRVASFVRSDVPLLRNLGFKTVARPGDPNAGKTVYLPGPGKRLTTVVDGDVAYIATEDGARYFEGSLLPGGHRVHRISAAGIEVEDDDGVSILSF